ncbi:MAG: hypothetical protein MUC29_05490 [Pyrinomonadaceae bacterium]|jgi:hypothetical protein|nr:hypothetical protein [Pyrinomonadaceae bacterium]
MQIWQTILAVAIQSPSPHNVQPWRIKIISDTKAELYIDSTRTLPKEDLTGSFIILTMGMFLESIRLLAEPKGFQLSYELFHSPDWFAPAILEEKSDWLIPFAKLTLTQAQKIDNPYNETLFTKRRTSRLNLKKELIQKETVNSLQTIATNFNQDFQITTDSNQIERIMSLNTIALFEDLNSADYHDEIVEWFRYSDEEALKHLDGLDYRCMNTPPILFWLSAKTPWTMKIPLLKNVLAKIYRSQTGNIPTLGIISGGFWKPSEAIENGKFLMQFWLETALHNIYIHPFGNLVTNRKIADLTEKDLGISDIWLIFKVGYSDEPPKSHRLPLEKILIK